MDGRANDTPSHTKQKQKTQQQQNGRAAALYV
jgi:hypothetical protein